jgi:hypothetical protein
MPPRNQPQPADEWTFVPRDDEVDTDEPAAPSAETAAMHLEQTLTPADDVGRADVALGDATEGPEYNFADEESERAAPEAVRPEGEGEPDLEEILESQHYAFEPEEEA